MKADYKESVWQDEVFVYFLGDKYFTDVTEYENIQNTEFYSRSKYNLSNSCF